jgi:hypothetical protein
MHGHLMLLAAFFVESQPLARALDTHRWAGYCSNSICMQIQLGTQRHVEYHTQFLAQVTNPQAFVNVS